MNILKSKLAITMAFFSVLSLSVCAQTDGETNNPHSVVQVSFFPPLSTNGLHSGNYTNDISFNLLAGYSRNERILAFAGLANIMRNDASGVQFAGLANVAGGDISGLQFAGLANITGHRANGLQFAGLANVVGGDVNGLQMAGLFNVAKRVKGVQIAGLVNIAEHSDYPIGLINIIKDGEMGVAVGYNEFGTASLIFRSGGRVLYGIIGVGYNHRTEKSKDAFIGVGGFGAHINLSDKFRINNELTMDAPIATRNDLNNTFKAAYALLPAYKIGKHFEVFGGPNISYMQTKDTGLQDLPVISLWKDTSKTTFKQLYVGWQAGVQVTF